MKSTVQQIRERFDNEVERFSNLETGQSATMDAPLCLELVTEAAAVTTPDARELLDIGAGAGNFTLKMLQRLPALTCTVVDLSKPMLDRALERIRAVSGKGPRALQGDMRTLDFGKETYDIVLAAATLHHLRTDAEWRAMFAKIYAALRPGGSFWVFDMIEQASAPVHGMMWRRYGEYLAALKGGGAAGEKYRNDVFSYIEAEDTPKPLVYQLELMREVGFVAVDVLHKNGPFAAFGGKKQ